MRQFVARWILVALYRAKNAGRNRVVESPLVAV
jgi:hypothetical protein